MAAFREFRNLGCGDQSMIPSELSIGRFSKGIVLRIVGRGTMTESPAFRAAFEHGPAAGIVVFDATRCDYVDSTFLGCLIWMKKACERSAERSFVIAASDSTRIKLFSTSSLSGYFNFIDACPKTVDTFVKIDVGKLHPEELGRHVMHCHELLADMGGDKPQAFKAVADRLAQELGEKAHKPVSE
jgi:anti-anti-sigma regulatory factor